MSSNKVPEDRCGHTIDNSYFPGPPGSVTCWRKTWQNGRCIWHEASEQKPIHQLVESRTDHPERLDEAVLRRTELRNAVSFNSCNLMEADFTGSNIMGADFSNAMLANASFMGANLPGADFYKAYLLGTNFSGSNLTNASLNETKLEKTNFSRARIAEGTSFKGKSGWEDVADNQARKGSFLARNISPWFRAFGRRNSNTSDLETAARQYRFVQRLLRENNRHELPELTIREKHVRRKQALADENYWTWLKFAFYRRSLGYGERIGNVIGSSVVTVLAFALVYPFVGGIEATSDETRTYAFSEQPTLPFEIPQWIEVFGGNLYFSTVTFTTLGYGDIQPASSAVQILASIESLLGALLMAFLVFVLGRRVTW